MILYEVTIRVEAEIADEYRHWLGEHVAEIVRLPGFLGAEIYRRLDVEGDVREYIAAYRLVDTAALERYLREDAPAMRQEAISRFGERFTATRRNLVHESALTPESP